MVATVTRPKKTTRKPPAKKAVKKASGVSKTGKKINLGKRQGPRSEEWKAASRFGHEATKLIEAYLAILHEPKLRMPSEKQVDRIAAEKTKATGLRAVLLRQEEKNVTRALTQAIEGDKRLKVAEEGFVKVAKQYSAKKGVTYDTWRDAGVPAPVLKRAGIPRTRVG